MAWWGVAGISHEAASIALWQYNLQGCPGCLWLLTTVPHLPAPSNALQGIPLHSAAACPAETPVQTVLGKQLATAAQSGAGR